MRLRPAAAPNLSTAASAGCLSCGTFASIGACYAFANRNPCPRKSIHPLAHVDHSAPYLHACTDRLLHIAATHCALLPQLASPGTCSSPVVAAAAAPTLLDSGPMGRAAVSARRSAIFSSLSQSQQDQHDESDAISTCICLRRVLLKSRVRFQTQWVVCTLGRSGWHPCIMSHTPCVVLIYGPLLSLLGCLVSLFLALSLSLPPSVSVSLSLSFSLYPHSLAMPDSGAHKLSSASPQSGRQHHFRSMALSSRIRN